MKRPTVFITYFQRSVQFEHVYQVLLSKHFFQKNGDCFNLTSIFPCLNNSCKKTYEKTYLFLHIYTNSLSRSTLSQSFTIWKFLLKKCQLFQNLNKFSLIWASLSNFCMKTYKRTYRFYDIFSKFLLPPKFSQKVFTNFSNFEKLLRENLWKAFNFDFRVIYICTTTFKSLRYNFVWLFLITECFILYVKGYLDSPLHAFH